MAGPRRGRGGSRSGWAARATPWNGDTAPRSGGLGAGRSQPCAVPPPYDASSSPKTASPDGGTYTRRYYGQEPVNDLGHGRAASDMNSR